MLETPSGRFWAPRLLPNFSWDYADCLRSREADLRGYVLPPYKVADDASKHMRCQAKLALRHHLSSPGIDRASHAVFVEMNLQDAEKNRWSTCPKSVG